MMSMGQLLNLMVFHKQFLEYPTSPGVVYIKGATISHIQQTTIVREIHSDNFFHVLLDDFGGFEIAHDVFV